jgi:hypothetical protein
MQCEYEQIKNVDSFCGHGKREPNGVSGRLWQGGDGGETKEDDRIEDTFA